MIDWERVLYLTTVSRFLDDTEENRLVPEKKVLYQFSARGHEVAQIILGQHLTHPHDGVGAYYRSRPLLLSLGLSFADALASPMGKSGGFSDGRDIGVVCNLPNNPGPVVLPMSGDVGSQYTPAAGWAQAITYYRDVLGATAYAGAIACVTGGEASVATNGFWSALTIASTLKLPMLFYIEDNGYGISVPASFQTPGGDVAANLASFKNLLVRKGDGTDPAITERLVAECVAHARGAKGPALLRLTMPRLSGHSGQDTQAYKPPELIEREKSHDPLPRLEKHLLSLGKSELDVARVSSLARKHAENALVEALERPEPDPLNVLRHRVAQTMQQRGGLGPMGHKFPSSSETPAPEGPRINLLTAIRRALESELKSNPKLLVFGEDVGPKGGVHAATLGLQEAFGDKVFKTVISKSIRLEESPAHRESIFTFAPQSSGAYEYYKLCEEVIERV